MQSYMILELSAPVLHDDKKAICRIQEMVGDHAGFHVGGLVLISREFYLSSRDGGSKHSIFRLNLPEGKTWADVLKRVE